MFLNKVKEKLQRPWDRLVTLQSHSLGIGGKRQITVNQTAYTKGQVKYEHMREL
jgi:hypothetical protein